MAKENNSPLPLRLKQARKAKDISQKELGIRLGMEPGTASARMNQYEQGKHTPDYTTLKRMADELGVPVAYFFCSSEKSARLVCLLESLSDSEKDTLIDMLLTGSQK
ncbi:helix-turn-helix domain-containing protein [Agarivorans sp. B2Z047]|uniref:helix-turn-helix domain-containing protein n=1 Tax=Agarivorans sp. B2Z047 TaxID=2652721 RepID=UPI00128B704E|nr:helix-turn-helix transcriptional regulator [Agarivorans sp. B2Z047]MPW31622.1 helix-turn-helix domain-containing protein [Agarivorans sp. B2Z047]UQN42418.1 helix-turn-helix domain-containing protein [Agarivorans sp. B2Z047]